jgi:hypothetical protein
VVNGLREEKPETTPLAFQAYGIADLARPLEDDLSVGIE